jgi:uncharacterized membrane protein YdjX (TVP38/TMEM64 family)
MADLERPKAPTSVRIAGIAVLVIAAWLLFGSALSVVGAFVALFGYVVVAVIAFYVGHFVGRHSRDRAD